MFKEKLQPTTIYRYTYNPETFKYAGITYDHESKNITDIVPHFEIGHVTCFDKDKKEWTLIKDSEFYSKVSKNYDFKQYETYVLEAILENQRALEAFLFKTKNTEIENIYKGVVKIDDTLNVIHEMTNLHLKALSEISKQTLAIESFIDLCDINGADRFIVLREHILEIQNILNKPNILKRILKWLKNAVLNTTT